MMESKSDISKLLEEIEIKAVKRFAERLKDTSEDRTDWGHPYVLCTDIDNLVKEIEGESE